MLQNMVMAAFTPLGDQKEIHNWENYQFTMTWPFHNQQKGNDEDVPKIIKKKPKRVRTAFTTDQIRTLEKYFSHHKYISTGDRKEMAKYLDLSDKCIKIWFQNRRMKEKKESSESSCDSSSESFNSESITQSISPQTNNEDCNTEYTTQYSTNNSNQECSYQLPSYYGMHDIYQNGYAAQSYVAPTCNNDDNIYPRHYYSHNMNYINIESNVLNNYCGNEMNQYWGSNYNAYCAPT